jgi:hypothetical protein
MQKIIKLLKDTDYAKNGIITFFIVLFWFFFFIFNSPSELIKYQLGWVLFLLSIAIIIKWIVIIFNKNGKKPILSLAIQLCMLSSIWFLIDISNALIELAKSIEFQYLNSIFFVKNLMSSLLTIMSLNGIKIFKTE